MDATFERRVLRLYDLLLDQPEAARETWLAIACANDRAMADAVQTLVDAETSALSLPTRPPGGGVISGEFIAPERIGNYRLTGELGRGGMGIVFGAKRDDGLFDHEAAIKLIRGTIFSDQVLAQFATERRILARLRHPHIAQMFDGGVTPDGASYIVMERITGETITEHCAARDLPLADRLGLFREAATAIEYAHRNLIVHADIKPSNVVVEEGFGVKLLDFGIARLMDEAAASGIPGFTPGYASPARIKGAPPTPSDDIFAAGVLLDALIKDQPGADSDLAAVVAKARARLPEQRYGAMNELVDDIDRWLKHRPTRAAQPGQARRLYLYWRRNRLAVILAGLALTGLIAAVLITTVLYFQSEQRRAAADKRFAQARGMTTYIISDFDPDLARLPGSLPLRRKLVTETSAYLQTLEADRTASTALKIDLASGYLHLARIYGLDPSGGIGDIQAARRSLDHANTLLAKALSETPADPKLLFMEAEAKIVEGSEIFVVPDAATAQHSLTALNAAEDLLQRYLTVRPGDNDARLDLWRTQVMTGRAYIYLDQEDAGRRIVEAKLGNAALPGLDAGQRATRDYILNASYLMLGEAYETLNKAKSIDYYSRLIDQVAKMQAQGASDWQTDFMQASALSERAEQNGLAGALTQAIKDDERSIDIRQRWLALGDNHEIAAEQSYVREQLADLYARNGQMDQGRTASDQAISWAAGDLAKTPDSSSRARLVALLLSNRGVIERKANNRSAACHFDQRALTIWTSLERTGGAFPTDTAQGGPAQKNKAAVAKDC